MSTRNLSLEKFWRTKIAERETSTLKVSEFCQREGLSVSSYNFWKSEITRRESEASDAKASVPVDDGGTSHLEITLPDGTFLKLRGEACKDISCSILQTLLNHRTNGKPPQEEPLERRPATNPKQAIIQALGSLGATSPDTARTPQEIAKVAEIEEDKVKYHCAYNRELVSNGTVGVAKVEGVRAHCYYLHS